MVNAWRFDESKDDQREPHKGANPSYVTLEELKSIGVLYFNIPVDQLKDNTCPALEKLRKERGYKNFDVIEVAPDKLPGYEKKIKTFFEEHLHVDEEIRYILAGSGYFDVRSRDDSWIRIEVKPSDLIILPAGIYHRFTNDTNNYIKAMRLFQDEPVWTPYNRGPDTDKFPQRSKFVENLKAPPVLVTPGVNGTSYILRHGASGYARYPHLREVGDFLYVSGTSSRRPDNTHVGAVRNADGTWTLDIGAQTEAVLQNINNILSKAGASLENVVDMTVFLVDMKHYKGMNEVYNRHFQAASGPTRTCVAVHQLPHPNLLVEMKAIAVRPQSAQHTAKKQKTGN